MVLVALSLAVVTLIHSQDKPCEEELTELRTKYEALQKELAQLQRGVSRTPTVGEGYDRTKWGMSPDEVRVLYHDKEFKGQDNIPYFEGQTAGKDSVTVFYFTQAQLTAVAVILNEAHTNRNAYLAEYQFLKQQLTKKYGDPTEDESRWLNDLYQDDPDEYGFAVSLGHLTLLSKWETKGTEIELSCSGKNFKISNRIQYASSDLKNLMKEASTKKILEGL
jgi:hypothetical protein